MLVTLASTTNPRTQDPLKDTTVINPAVCIVSGTIMIDSYLVTD